MKTFSVKTSDELKVEKVNRELINLAYLAEMERKNQDKSVNEILKELSDWISNNV